MRRRACGERDDAGSCLAAKLLHARQIPKLRVPTSRRITFNAKQATIGFQNMAEVGKECNTGIVFHLQWTGTVPFHLLPRAGPALQNLIIAEGKATNTQVPHIWHFWTRHSASEPFQTCLDLLLLDTVLRDLHGTRDALVGEALCPPTSAHGNFLPEWSISKGQPVLEGRGRQCGMSVEAISQGGRWLWC